MQDHLVAITGSAAIETAGQCTLGETAQRVRPPLCRVVFVTDSIAGRGLRGLLKQPVGGRLDCALHDGTDLRRQPAAEDHHPLVIDVQRQGPMPLALLRLLRSLEAIDPPPGADEALDVGGCAGQGQIDEPPFVLGRGDPREGAHLGVRQRPALHRRADARKGRQRAGDSHLLARRAEIDPGPPMQPVSARQTPVVPAGAGIELAQQDEELVRGRVHAGGQLGDRLAEVNHIALTLGSDPIAARTFTGNERW